VIRVAIVDDHPALRAGLRAALESEWGLEPAGEAARAEDVPALAYRTRPDVVLVDYHLPGRDGLAVCLELKGDVPAPGVVLYSAYADASLVVPAIVAGADAIVHKGAPAAELFAAVRAVAGGATAFPPVPAEQLELALGTVDGGSRELLAALVRRAAAGAGRAPVGSREQRARLLSGLKVPVLAGG
jgi:DNA-binding NarL/FixJ family response regulator